MWPFSELPDLGAAHGTLALPIWAVGVAAVLVLALAIAAVVRARSVGALLLVLLAALGGWAVWARLDRERVDEHRTLQARVSALQAQATVPGSALGCLEAPFGDALDAACERSLFASPESTAAGLSATASRLTLVREALATGRREDSGPEGGIEALRRPLEQDPFGFTAQVLATRNGCTAEHCDAFALLRDPARVTANLRERRFEAAVARYSPAWTPKAGADGTATALRGGSPATYSLPGPSSIPSIGLSGAEPAASGTVAGFPPPPAAEPAAAPPPAAAPKPAPPRPARPPTPPKPPQARPPGASPGAGAARTPPPSAAPPTVQ